MRYHLAIDIGASSGRHILGSVQDGKLVLETVFRFENAMCEQDGHLTWDIESLTASIIEGIKECGKIGKIPETIAIDTWGVDYVLMDDDNKEIKPTYAYRDSRTADGPESVDKIIPRDELYKATGITPLVINTIYQLFDDTGTGRLNNAKVMLMMPDYLGYRLTGVMEQEYTIASTSGLVSTETNDWNYDIIDRLGIKREIFLPISLPATRLGNLSKEIAEYVGFDATVVHAPSHDTASAVAACPIDDKSVYISSGTWSLIGTENSFPVTDYDACKDGLSNEGGVEYRFRFLKNIIGMWIFQNIRKNTDKKYSYDEMMNMAMDSEYQKTFDPNAPDFLAPESMVEAIRNYLGDKDLPLGDVLKSSYLSIANSYDKAIKTIERFSNKKVESILIVGGGSKDKYLNSLTSKITGKKVYTGLSEGTATGNILSQIMYSDNLKLDEARQIIKNSFEFKEN